MYKHLFSILKFVGGNWRWIGAAGLLTGAFYLGYNYKAGEVAVHQKKALQTHLEEVQKLQNIADEERARRNRVAAYYEKQLKAQKIQVREVEKIVEKEIEKTIYKECKLPETGTKIINETVEKLNGVRNSSEINIGGKK